MNDTPSSGDGSVLRPFQATEQAPLPPVEPSKVVPAPPPLAAVEPLPAPPVVVEPMLEEAVFEEAVVEDDVVEEEVVEAAWPEDETVIEDEPVDEIVDDDSESDPWAPAHEAVVDDTADDDTADDDEAVVDETAVEAVALDESLFGDSPPEDDGADESGILAADEDDQDLDAGIAAAATAVEPTDDRITLPRKPFLVGLGLMVAVIAGLAILWQSAGGTDAETATPTPSSVPRVVDEPVDIPPVVSVDTGAFDQEIAGLNADLATAQAEAASLSAEVEQLESRPPPALPGSQLRRIVVGADAKFVSSQPESVAVVGAFGGLSLIDPSTNRVVANGNVANGADRVMRTATSVWLTNYTDNQILRVDPATNSVAATFPFPGPDGIDKDGDTIVVASFDGGFVARVSPGSGETLQSIEVGGEPTAVMSHPDHGLWVAIFDTGEIVQIDRDSFEILQRVTVGAGPVGIGFDATHLWVTNHDEGTIAKVDPVTGDIAMTVVVGDGPTEVVVVDGSAWVTVTDAGNLVQVDANSGDIITRTPLGGTSAGGGPTGIAYGNDSIWVAMNGEQSVVRIEL